MTDEFRIYPPIITKTEWNALLDHGLIKPASYVVRNNSGTYQVFNGSTGKIEDSSGTNFTTALQSIIDSLTSAGGGEIYLLPGTYTLTSSLILKSYVSLIGSGWGELSSPTLLYLGSGSNCTMLDTPTTSKNYHITVKNMKLDGNISNNSGTCHGIDIRGTDRVLLENLVVFNTQGHGVKFEGNDGGGCGVPHINRLYTYNTSGSGLYMSGVDGFFSGLDLGNATGSATWASLYLYWAHKNCFVNSCFWGGKQGIYINQSSNNRFIGCRADLNAQEGVYIAGGSHFNVIDGCQVTDNGQTADNTYDGILLSAITSGYPCTHNVIANCFIGGETTTGSTPSPACRHRYSVNEYGAYVDYTTIIGNDVRWNSSYSKKIYKSGSNTVLKHNMGYDLESKGYASGSNGVQIAHNLVNPPVNIRVTASGSNPMFFSTALSGSYYFYVYHTGSGIQYFFWEAESSE